MTRLNWQEQQKPPYNSLGHALLHIEEIKKIKETTLYDTFCENFMNVCSAVLNHPSQRLKQALTTTMVGDSTVEILASDALADLIRPDAEGYIVFFFSKENATNPLVHASILMDDETYQETTPRCIGIMVNIAHPEFKQWCDKKAPISDTTLADGLITLAQAQYIVISQLQSCPTLLCTRDNFDKKI